MTTAQFAKSSCLFGGSLEEAPWRGARRDQMSPVPGSGWDASRGPWMLGPPKWEQLAQGHCRAGRSVRPSASRPGTGDVRTAHVRGWRLSRRRLALGTAPPTAHTSVPRCLRPSPASLCSLQISEPAPILLEASGPSLSPHPSSPRPSHSTAARQPCLRCAHVSLSSEVPYPPTRAPRPAQGALSREVSTLLFLGIGHLLSFHLAFVFHPLPPPTFAKIIQIKRILEASL